jgi:hypothetical protein
MTSIAGFRRPFKMTGKTVSAVRFITLRKTSTSTFHDHGPMPRVL